jgi:hypothetical protein
MTRLSATATIAALLLLAIAQGFGATSSTKSTVKSSPKVAKSTAKPYHITAQNQFHIQSKKPSKAQARLQAKRVARAQGQHGPANPLVAAGRRAATPTPAPAPGPARALTAKRSTRPTRLTRTRRQQANPPPSGTLGFVSATQIADGGANEGQVQTGTLTSLTSFITVVNTAAGCAYSEVAANGDGTFTAPAATLTLVPDPYGVAGDDCSPNYVVGDVNGDGNSDIVQADSSGATVSITALLSNGDGTFTAVASGIGAPSPFTIAPAAGITGGALVMNTNSGFLDLVIVDDDIPSNLTTYAGLGDGTFGVAGLVVPVVAASTTALIPDPTVADEGNGYNVIIEDLDGDGTVDVAENDNGTGQLVVYLSSAATPYTGTAYSTPDGVYDACNATAGSITGASGLPAIVDVNCDDDTVTVYNNSSGAFSAGVYFPVAVTPTNTPFLDPYGVVIADVNGDGNGDVVITNQTTADVTVLLSNGTGGLGLTSVGYAVGGDYPYGSAIVTDLNGDGLPDILVADDNQSLVWMAGFGDGTFQASQDSYSPFPDNVYATGISIASGDFNGDGFTDIVVSNYGDNTVGFTVYLSNPDGSLQPGVVYGSSGDYGYVTVADFNGDGNLDIAASNYEGYVQIFSGTGTGNFIAGPFYSTGGAGQYGIVSGAFNTTTGVAGFADLAVVSLNATATVLVNSGTGGFTVGVPITLTSGACEVAAASLNAPTDTNLDLAVSECDGTQIGVLLGDGTGAFTPAPDVPVAGSPYGIALGDVNGDGIPDIVASSGNQSIALALGTGPAAFATAILMPSSIVIANGIATGNPFNDPDPSEVQITDVNGDGFPDLVYTNSEYSTVGVMFGTGTGSATAPYFYDPVEFPVGGFGFGLTIADVNGDGSPDAATADNTDGVSEASVLINANGTGAAPNFSLSVSGQSSPAFLNIPAGATATATITLTPVNFYSGTVTFSCGGTPLGVTCTFAPATLTPVGNAPLTTQLTVTTTASHSALRMPADANPHQGRTSLLACLTGMGLFGLLLSGDWKNRRNRRIGILLGILVLGMMFSLVGCSSSTTPGTPVGAQTIQVTGTGSDGTTNSVNLTINVF